MSNSFELYATKESPYEIYCRLIEPLNFTGNQNHDLKAYLKMEYVNFPNNFRNTYCIGTDGISRFYNRFRLHCGYGTPNYVVKDISIDSRLMYDLKSLLDMIMEACNQMLSPSDIDPSMYGPFNITYGIDEIRGLVYFNVDDTINPNLNAYSLEFTESITDSFNGNVGFLFGCVNFKTAPLLGRQYPNAPPLAQFVLSQVQIRINKRIKAASNLVVAQLPSNLNITQAQGIIYSFSSLMEKPYSMTHLTSPTLMQIEIVETYLKDFTISFHDIAGEPLKACDDSALSSIRFCIFNS